MLIINFVNLDGGDDIEDISDLSGLVIAQSTLAAGVHQSLVMQVHRQGVIIVSQMGSQVNMQGTSGGLLEPSLFFQLTEIMHQ